MKTNEMIGALIRKERNKRNWSLKGLAKDICAVSYLSKIEMGKADCSEDILKLLFERLSVDWHGDSAFLNKAQLFVRRTYESIFAMEEIAFSKGDRKLLEEMEHSMYVMDAMIIVAWENGCADDSLLEMQAYMDERQLCLVYLLEKRYREAVHIEPCALTYYHAGMHGYVLGNNYEEAMWMLERAYRLAADEGYAEIMFQSALIMGNLAGNLLDVNTMLHHYGIAQRLARVLHKEDDQRTMQYNKAAVLIETGQAEQAYQYFHTLDNLTVMERHKFAIAAELTDRKEEAFHILSGNEQEMDALTAKMYQIVEMRLRNAQYLEDSAYGELLLEVFETCRKDLPIGYAAFHVPWVLHWYVHHRQYRAAFELSHHFPIKVPFLKFIE